LTELRLGSVHGSAGTGAHDSSVAAKFTSSAVPVISCRTSFALSRMPRSSAAL
jgi:hypothetical protein